MAPKLAQMLLLISLTLQLNQLTTEANEATPTSPDKPKCNIFKYVGANDLGIHDIVVKSPERKTNCIKARFSLAIKVSAPIENTIGADNANEQAEGDIAPMDEQQHEESLVLGYLPMDNIRDIDDSCPELPANAKLTNSTNTAGNATSPAEPEELDMVVMFECGKLGFTFKRSENFYLSSIRGVVNLDGSTMREFVAKDPMFFTSDLAHHFKFNDLIQVNSSAESKAFILTANFYNLEFEAFRNTTSRDFVRPPDENSTPFLSIH